MAGLFSSGPLGMAAATSVGTFASALQQSGKLPSGPMVEEAAAALGVNLAKTGGAVPEPYYGNGQGIVQPPRATGIMAWIRMHPLLSTALGVGAIFLLWRLFK